jgi:transcriptional regulator with XRE-family HTH domain
MVRGRKPDWERRRLVADLRSQGLTLGQIAERLGVTRQAVHQLLSAQGVRTTLACCLCGAEVARGSAGNRPVRCLACLDKQPEATLGQRLKTYRLVRGLTQKELAAQAGVGVSSLRAWEQGKCLPAARVLARLLEVQGARLAFRFEA